MKNTSLYALLLSLICFSAHSQDRTSGKSFATRSEVLARNGMVATNHPLATQVGLDILKGGGSAIDAAIAANALLGFADPGMNGIGGDLFAIVWDAKTQKLYGINGSGHSAREMSLQYLQEQKKKGVVLEDGVLSVTTPGCVDAWFELNKKFGKLPMAALLQPAIAYAEAGIPVAQEIADNMKQTERWVLNSDHANFKALFLTNGHFPRKGDIFKNPDLAATLRLISKKGRDAFYKGDIAAKIEAHIKGRGGFLNRQDLAAHQAEWVEPISAKYRGYDVWELPPNGQGMGVLQILTILEGVDMSKFGYGSAGHMHYFLEAKKLAYEDMVRYYGDPAFGHIPIKELLSTTYAAERRALIDTNRAGVYHPGFKSGDHTIYLTAADKEGNMISLIQSNSSLFGSGEVVKGLGFPLQNRGAGFILEEGHINTYAPGKRPFHTIIPGFVTRDGKPFMSFGVMGGDMQVQGHVQILMNILDFGMNLQEAGDAPRMYHSGSVFYKGHSNDAGEVFLESGFKPEVLGELLKKRHKILMGQGMFGGYQAIMLKDGVYYGASESRKDGHAAGY